MTSNGRSPRQLQILPDTVHPALSGPSDLPATRTLLRIWNASRFGGEEKKAGPRA